MSWAVAANPRRSPPPTHPPRAFPGPRRFRPHPFRPIIRVPPRHAAMRTDRIDDGTARLRARTDRAHAHGQGPAPGYRRLRAVPETGKCQSRRLDQGPDRPVDDRGGRASRRPQARRHPGRGHRRQYRHRRSFGGAAEGLPAHPRGPGQDEPGEDLQPQGDGRRGGADPLGRGQGPSRVLLGTWPRASRPKPPVPTSSTSSAIPTTRPRTRPAPARKSSRRWPRPAGSTPSCSAAAARAR